jgi:hypothetical protein
MFVKKKYKTLPNFFFALSIMQPFPFKNSAVGVDCQSKASI